MIEIKSLSNSSFNSVYLAFKEAFRDYEMQLNKEELRTMLKRRGYNPRISFAAFENDKIVAFTLNGMGMYNGIKTAYDTGTGTLKEYRGQGLATKIFNHSISFLKKAGISQYLLEVLQHNVKAVSVYKKLGFEVSREFNYFVQKTDALPSNCKSNYPDYRLKQINLKEKEVMKEFWDFIPSWQNSFAAISRKPKDFISNGIYFENKPLWIRNP